MSLLEELNKLGKLTKNQKEEGINQIKKIVGLDADIIYQIVNVLILERMDRGFSKEFSLNELLMKFPLKKSRLITRLQLATEMGILKHEKRRYLLNKNNDLVSRIWNYYNDTKYKDNRNIIKIRNLIREKKELEEQIENNHLDLKLKFRKLSTKEEKNFESEILDEIKAFQHPIEPTFEFLKLNIEKTLGYKKANLKKEN